MRIVFMGTPDFAETTLEGMLNNGRDVAAVFTQPDKPQGRKMILEAPPVKKLAQEKGIPVYQPDTLRDGEAFGILQNISPDIIVVVAYGKLIPDEIIALPKYGCINVHASLLPKYRGSAPIQWSILNGDDITGVTTMYIGHELDAGDIIYKSSTEIGEYETSGELFERLSIMGSELLERTLEDIEKGIAPRIPQIHEDATYTTKINKSLSPIDWNRPSSMVIKQICGLQPWPGATGIIAGNEMKIISAENVAKTYSCGPGSIADYGKDYLIIACREGAVSLKTVQLPGKRAMNISEFLNGHKLG